MINILYVFMYSITYELMNKLYLVNNDSEYIENNTMFYYSLINMKMFTLFIYGIYIIRILIYYKEINKISVLSLIYIKYILNILCNSMTLTQFELNRNIMWVFTTPTMFTIYCNINKIKLQDIKFGYHIVPVILNVFVSPYKNEIIYYYFIGFAWILYFIFMKNLYDKRNLMYTNTYMYIWFIFIFLNLFDVFQIVDRYTINLYYSYADMICKIIVGIIINDYNENEIIQINNRDLQSTQFISYMVKNINKYKTDNSIISQQCIEFIDYTKTYFLTKIPENKTILEQELLKKILPFNFDKEYISAIDLKTENQTKQFNMICVLFTDIVNYTELANKYNDKIIFQLLFTMYDKFDTIIKKYQHLQKIETIGDAYMVVGDIYRNTFNHVIVIKEIIMFALEILTEIKNIKTPDNSELAIRIGINMGNVTIGILGNEVPRLCVVGNAVNVAARLQSTAEPDTIQMSRHIFEQLENINFDTKFEVVKKENVFLKNIGSVSTFNILTK